MSIQFKFFTVSIHNSESTEGSINLFLRQHKVLSIYREFVENGENSHWCMAVEYLQGGPITQATKLPGKNRIDYKEVLPPDDFTLFVKLRDWRKKEADRAAVPVYAIFSNEQLATIASLRVVSKTSLREIDGIGEARVSKYGDALLSLMVELTSSPASQNADVDKNKLK
jgi:superfamily II DNA helicase RecQ